MRYASVCSGVGTCHLALTPHGFECAWFSEIDPFPNAVLEHRFPGVPNLGDMTSLSDEELDRYGPIDVLVGGTPCQGFSVAGRGAGMDDPRSSLARDFVRLADRLSPRWVLWENVGGVRNSKHARSLLAFIEAFREVGYLGCFRSLDSRYFAVAQRRDRVFALFHRGDWRPPTAALLEPDCVRRDLANGREARKDVASAITRSLGSGGADDNKAQAGHLVASTLRAETGRHQVEATYLPVIEPLARCDTSREGQRRDGGTENLIGYMPDLADPICANEARTQSHGGNNPRARNVIAFEDVSATLDETTRSAKDSGTYIGVDLQNGALRAPGEAGTLCAEGQSRGNRAEAVLGRLGVRRLTPLECERLMGMPDGWTLVPYKGKPAKDSPRYKAIGNAWVVPVVSWIGRRLAMVDGLASVSA